ncbi:MAG: hypothetical protein ACJA05_002410 [Porticoccus sp.]
MQHDHFAVPTWNPPFDQCVNDIILTPYPATESSVMKKTLDHLTIGVFAKAAGVNVESQAVIT